MLYSLIVSVYKVEKYLRKCIDSVLNQTYTNFELILVDDGSPDQCPKICDEYANKDNRVKVIHKKNGGLVSTRKAGTAIARGQYICFIDGDDFISKNMLETYENVLAKASVDIICTGFSEFSENNVKPVRQKIPEGLYKKEDLEKNIYPHMLSTEPFFSFYIFPSLWAKCVKSNIMKSVYNNMPENITLGEDVAASYPALLHADSVYISDYCGYMYRQNLESMTHTYDSKLYEKERNLLVHLRKCEVDMKWSAGNQIDEYAVYLLYLARNNEFYYNPEVKYSKKKKKMLEYLNDDLFSLAVSKITVRNPRDKFIVNCFQRKIVFPFYFGSLNYRKG